MAQANTGMEAARMAAAESRAQLSGSRPALAIVFASPAFEDLDHVGAAVVSELGDVPIVGGTSGGCVIGPRGVAARGVSVVLLGGDDIAVSSAFCRIASADLHEVVAVAKGVARAADEAAARELTEFACLAFAPGVHVDGESLVAAVRKGTGPRAQLAGALTGDDLTFDRMRVFAGGELRADAVALAGVFTRTPLGIAARHGWRAVGPTRTVSRGDGPWLVELDGKPAFDVWREDARAAGGDLPEGRGQDVALYLANHFNIGVIGADGEFEPRVRAPFAIREDGAVQLAGSLGERARTRVMQASRGDLLEAALQAASTAAGRAGPSPAGALVLSCSARLSALGDDFPREPASIARQLGAPVGGACVFGEIARTLRDVDAFHNTTTVVVAMPGARS